MKEHMDTQPQLLVETTVAMGVTHACMKVTHACMTHHLPYLVQHEAAAMDNQPEEGLALTLVGLGQGLLRHCTTPC